MTGLRNWLEQVDDRDELFRVSGAHWEREMGAISEIVEQRGKRQSPALLFDDIPGYPSGYRTLYNQFGSVRRLALGAGLPEEYDHITDFAAAFQEATGDVEPLPTETVSSGPVFDNVRTGDDIDLAEVPAPQHHEKDGGRYLGTVDCVFTRDRDSGWINVGTYRAQIKTEDELFVYISPGKHGRLHLDSYFEDGEPFPIMVTFGQDPTLYIASCTGAEVGVNELEYAGGIRGQPYEVIEGPETGLPIPADAEVAVEGYLHPDATGEEGPFGEWMGYYGSGSHEEPYMQVEGMYFRDDPIVVCAVPHKPPGEVAFFRAVPRSALLKQQLENGGVPNVQGVWCHEPGGNRLFNVVSIKQRYAGHARQAGILAAQTQAGAYAGRWTVVVDEDIDPADLDEVYWAMSTRCDPDRDIEYIDRAWSTPLDVMVPNDEKDNPFNSRAIVDATIPFERMDEFPPVAESTPAFRERMIEEYGDQLPSAITAERS